MMGNLIFRLARMGMGIFQNIRPREPHKLIILSNNHPFLGYPNSDPLYLWKYPSSPKLPSGSPNSILNSPLVQWLREGYDPLCPKHSSLEHPVGVTMLPFKTGLKSNKVVPPTRC